MEHQFCSPGNKAGIAYYGGNGRKVIGINEFSYTGYASKWSKGETVKLTLDLTHEKYGVLSMTKDGKDLGILYDKIDIEQEYCLAVAIKNGYIVYLCYE